MPPLFVPAGVWGDAEELYGYAVGEGFGKVGCWLRGGVFLFGDEEGLVDDVIAEFAWVVGGKVKCHVFANRITYSSVGARSYIAMNSSGPV